MFQPTSERLKISINEILNIWEKRVYDEILAAKHQESSMLRDSLPEYLSQLSQALSKTIDRTNARKKFDLEESTRVGRKHGKERATSINYTMDQMILEYHILRQVIFDILEKDHPLTALEYEIIICSIEQAVNDAATEFSGTLADLQDQLTQTLAHDLRNPLSAAIISSQLVLGHQDTSDFCREKANRIARSLDRIDKMISDLLDSSRMKAGEKLPLQFSHCDLDWLIREIAYELNISHEDRLMVDSSGQCLGKWNENGLRRVIENLISNAFKYGLEDTPITVSLIQDENTAIISVHNHGEPIPVEIQANLFKKYKRASSSEKIIGWGLGLTIAKTMVEAHRGIINMESLPEKGTTFIVSLPKDPSKIEE